MELSHQIFKKAFLYDTFIIQHLIHNCCTIWMKRSVRWPKIIFMILQEHVILGGMEDITRLKSRNNFKIPHNIWISLDLAATLTALLRSTNVSIDLRRTLRLWSWFLAYIDNLNGFNEKIIFLCSLKFLVERVENCLHSGHRWSLIQFDVIKMTHGDMATPSLKTIHSWTGLAESSNV